MFNKTPVLTNYTMKQSKDYLCIVVSDCERRLIQMNDYIAWNHVANDQRR